MNEKTLVTESRKRESLRRWGSSEFNQLEQKYGKYLFVPLDVPLIKSNKHNELVTFYYQHAKLAERIKEDIAGSMDDTYRAKFLSLNSSDTEAADVWTKTYKPEFENTFKDLFDQIYEYLPIQKDTKISYTIWSTQSPVVMHRDHTSLLDLPLNFRIKLYDNNPFETLLIKNCLTDGVYQYQKNCSPILLPEETNTWTWNNARIVHGSTYDPCYKKMLMILEDLKIDWIKYETLLEKSLIKYKDHVLVDNTYQHYDYFNKEYYEQQR
jgi:hypothetical protein